MLESEVAERDRLEWFYSLNQISTHTDVQEYQCSGCSSSYFEEMFSYNKESKESWIYQHYDCDKEYEEEPDNSVINWLGS